ncbi:MAG: phage holin family protein [Actinobacteria bacterium]|nr:MAG: phage holin family protein [Actinomycetota bacterium]
MAAEPTGSPQQIAAALQEVSERAQLLVREEIELAKTEITEKLQRIVRGAVVGAVAGVFVLAALLLILHGFAWLAWWVLPVGDKQNYFWGFFFVAVILLILGVIAGFVAARFFRSGTPPKPELAIEEAQRIRETVQRA